LIRFFYILATSSLLFCDQLQQSEITLKTILYNDIQYLSLADFAKSHGLKSTYYNSKEKQEIIFENKKMYFSPFSSYCKIDDKIYHLTYEVILKNNALYVPVLPFYHILESINLPVQLVNKEKNTINVLTNIYNVKDFFINTKTNGVSIIINTTKEFYNNQISTSITSSGWLNITILNSAVDSLRMNGSALNYPISKVQTLQLGESSQISFLLNKKVDDMMVVTNSHSIEILLSIEQIDNIKKIQELRKKWLIDTIVIDPGHGGKDPGALGLNNLKEKND